MPEQNVQVTQAEIDIALFYSLLNAIGVFRWQQGRPVPAESVMSLDTVFERAAKCEAALVRIEAEAIAAWNHRTRPDGETS